MNDYDYSSSHNSLGTVAVDDDHPHNRDNDDEPRDHHDQQQIHHPLEEVELGDQHDQLPNVEEYKSSLSKNSWIDWNKKDFKLYSIISFIVILFIILFIAILTTVSHQSNNNSNTIPSEYSNNSQRFSQIIDLIRKEGYSREEALLFQPEKDGWTPQISAAYWLANVDELQIAIEPNIQFIQRYVMTLLYYSTNGTHWYDSYYFLSNRHVCLWNRFYATNLFTDQYQQAGIICSIEESNVIEQIYIPNNHLMGLLPPELALLSNSLQYMNFYNNILFGKIPEVYEQLTKLDTLILYQNQLQDTIPAWIYQLSNLQILNLGKNDIIGTIPTVLQQLSSLQIFNCDSCLLFGNIDSLRNMESLQSLNLGNNNLNGTISNELFHSLPQLIELDMNSNRLSGKLPTNIILNNSQLLILDLHDNLFTGHIIEEDYVTNTMELSKLLENNTIRLLSLANNHLIGRYDEWIGYLKELRYLDFSFNAFTGEIPRAIGNLTELRYLFLGMNPNYTAGPIPTEIGLLTQLFDVSFQKSNLIGPIPTEFGQLRSLIYLDLQNNQLNGTVPFQLESLKYTIEFLLLDHNQLTGTISNQLLSSDDGYLDTFTLQGNKNITSVPSDMLCNSGNYIIRNLNVDCSQLDAASLQTCSCCTCCDRNDTNEEKDPSVMLCHNFVYSPIDPNPEYNYIRPFYQLYEGDTIIPLYGISDQDYILYNNHYQPNIDGFKDVLIDQNTNDMFGYVNNRSKPWEEYEQDNYYNDTYLEKYITDFMDDQYINEVFDENYTQYEGDIVPNEEYYGDVKYGAYEQDHEIWTDIVIAKPVIYPQEYNNTSGPDP